MTSVVQIYNMALANIGSKSKVDSVGESSPEALACNLYFELARDTVLSSHEWGFARDVVALAMTSNTPLNTEWGFEYSLPTECVKVRRLLPQLNISTPVPFVRGISVDGYKVIWTNQEEAYVEYTRLVTDSTFYPPEFVLAVSWKLADLIVSKIRSESGGAKAMARQEYQLALSSARATDFSEGHIAREMDSEFIRART